MDVVLFSIFVAGLFTLVFLVLAIGVGLVVNGFPRPDYAKVRDIAKEYREALFRKYNQKKIFMFAIVSLFWIIGILGNFFPLLN